MRRCGSSLPCAWLIGQKYIKVRSHGATSCRDMLRGHVVRSESHEATKLGENKSHKRLYALGHTKRHFHATSRSVK